MNRLLLILSILLVLCFTTVIFALRGTNDYGDTINRDAMEEYRMTDHEDDDPFLYEWVQQNGNDSDGPVYSYGNVYAEMAYEQHFYTSASTTLGCNEDGVTGEYQASADVMGFGSQLGLTLHNYFSSTPVIIGRHDGIFSKSAYSSAEWVEDTDPLIINDYQLQYGNTRGWINVKEHRGEEANILHRSESEAPVEHPDVTIW